MRRISLSLLSSSASSLLILSIVFVAVLSPVAQAQNGRAVLITQHVDETKLAVLAGNTRPEANKKNDRGLVADDLPLEHMFLQLNRSPQQEQELLEYIEELQTPSSPNFHRWLTAKEYGERFGLAKQDLDTITRWMESHGFKVNVVYENGILIDFSGTAGQVRAAFHTEIHQLDVKGAKHFANMTDPRIPAALSPAVVGVVSLHDFKPHTHYKPRADYTTSGGYFAVVPADLATIYNLNPLFTASISGQGQTIVVVEDTNLFTAADWTTFRSTFGLSSFSGGSLSQIHPAPPSGVNNCTNPGINGDDGEAILDAEYASAAAPSAAIEVASCDDTVTFGGLIALQNLLDESGTPPAIMSMSYGECEAFNGATSNAAYNSAFQQAVTEGVSVFVSTGDEGAASCNADEANATHGIGVSAFASTPYNVAVGGTDFGDTYAGTNSTYWSATNSSTYGSALSYVPEIPWDDSCASVLLSTYEGFSQTWGSSGFCNSNNGLSFITTASGSGGPSGCATGSPSVNGVVGGTCAGWPKPSWQTLVGNPSDSVRDLPDVSLFAANGLWAHYYPFCWSDVANGGAPCTGTPDNWAGGGGTSFATPIMAGIQALINQKAGGRQGNPNPTYYSLAATEYGASGDTSCNSTLGNAVGASCIFYDVTQGDMDINCTGSNNCYLPSGTYGVLSTSNSSDKLAYGTATGWDFATGIGTVNAANLVNGWPVTLSATTTTLTSSENPANKGDTVTFTATVTTQGTNPPTGTVTFNDGVNSIGTGTLSTVSGAQVATLATSTLAVGTHSITAVYGGDSANAGSTSGPVSQVINGDATTTTLAPPNPNPAAYGAAVTLTATVTTGGPNKPTGTVTFYNGSTSLGTGTLNGSQVATLITSALPIGSDSITAVYGGDSNNSGSTSSILTETVNAPSFTLTPGVTTATVKAGIPATVYTFTVAPNAPAPNFGAPVTLSCSMFAPTDPTLTNSSCTFTGTGIQNNTIPANAGTTAVALTIATVGPNTTGDAVRRRRADNRSPWLPLTLPLAGIVLAGFAGRKVSKHSAAAGLCLSLILLGLLVACGGSSTPPIVVSVSGSPTSVYPNDSADGWPAQTAQFTATVNNSSNTAVTWAVTTANGGSIDQNGLYTAPNVPAQGGAALPTSVTITATSQADSTKSASASETLKPATIPGTYAVTVTVTDTAANPPTQTLPLTLIVQ